MSVADRNQRLDDLVKATQDWATKRKKELNDRVTLAESILKGRTGSSRLAQTAVDAGSTVVVAEINNFLLPSG